MDVAARKERWTDADRSEWSRLKDALGGAFKAEELITTSKGVSVFKSPYAPATAFYTEGEPKPVLVAIREVCEKLAARRAKIEPGLLDWPP